MSLDLNISLILHELILVVFACFILLSSVFTKVSKEALKSVSILALILSITCIVNLEPGVGFFNLLAFDNLAKYSSTLINLCAIYFLLANTRADEGEFFCLFLLMVACFDFMVSSNNLVILFITLEGSSLALYSLIAFKKRAIDAALKYFCYGMLGSAFFAMGAACYYYDSGSLELLTLGSMSYASMLSFIMIMLTIMFKLSIAPLHMWLKDVYKLSNSSLAGFISVVPKIAMMVLAFRFITSFGFSSGIILTIASISMLFASVISIKQSNAKDMLVYSSVSHSSFAFSALALSELAISGFLYYFITFAFVNMALFMFLGAYKNSSYDSFNGLFKKHPLLAISIVIMLLNLAALPPFGVFFAKVSIINIALHSSVLVAICMAFSSIIMLFAYLRFIQAIFKDGETDFIYFTKSQKLILILAIISSFIASMGMNYIN